MKKSILIALAAAFNLYVCNAQTDGEETIYLKNGSVIKGWVTEIVPGQSMTIQSSTGSTFVIKDEDISRYSRTGAVPQQRNVHADPHEQRLAFKEIERQRKEEARRINNNIIYVKKGYRGFFNGEFELGDICQMGFSTTHGYQLNSKFFVGAGVAFMLCEDSEHRVPLYASFRFDGRNKKVSPVITGRMGCEFIEDDDPGLCTSVIGGIRIKTFNMGMGFKTFDMGKYYEDVYDNENGVNFVFRIGFEF